MAVGTSQAPNARMSNQPPSSAQATKSSGTDSKSRKYSRSSAVLPSELLAVSCVDEPAERVVRVLAAWVGSFAALRALRRTAIGSLARCRRPCRPCTLLALGGACCPVAGGLASKLQRAAVSHTGHTVKGSRTYGGTGNGSCFSISASIIFSFVSFAFRLSRWAQREDANFSHRREGEQRATTDVPWQVSAIRRASGWTAPRDSSCGMWLKDV